MQLKEEKGSKGTDQKGGGWLKGKGFKQVNKIWQEGSSERGKRFEKKTRLL